jgi:hypothetical protein
VVIKGNKRHPEFPKMGRDRVRQSGISTDIPGWSMIAKNTNTEENTKIWQLPRYAMMVEEVYHT